MNQYKIAIIIPAYNDWISLDILITNIEKLLDQKIHSYFLIIVNDNSIIDIPDLPNFRKKK